MTHPPPRPRRIALFSGTRADFGHLQYVVEALRARDDVEVQLVLGGTHYEPRFGSTGHDIEAQGFPVAARIAVPLPDDTPASIVRFMGDTLRAAADALPSLAPDVLVLLGDRYEVLAMAAAALPLRVPIAHLHGGERTEGAFDESIRHAVTKLAHWHFAAAPEYAARLRQLGEAPARVFTVGAPGLDHLTRTALPGRAELASHLALSLPVDAPVLLVTYHPATLSAHDPAPAMAALTAALTAWLTANASGRVVVTGVNADPHHGIVAAAWHEWASSHADRVCVVASLGQARYLGLMKLAAAVVGNSSSGIIEAPALRVPTVNVGQRQHGRLMAASIVACPETASDIGRAITQATDPAFRASWPTALSRYGMGDASVRIASLLATLPLDDVLSKPFVDGPMTVA